MGRLLFIKQAGKYIDTVYNRECVFGVQYVMYGIRDVVSRPQPKFP